VGVIAIEIDGPDLFHRRVVDNGNECRKNLLVDLTRKCLSFAFVLVALPFDAMPEDLMEENAAGATGKNCGPRIGLDYGSFAKCFQICDDLVDGFSNRFFAGQPPQRSAE